MLHNFKHLKYNKAWVTPMKELKYKVDYTVQNFHKAEKTL